MIVRPSCYPPEYTTTVNNSLLHNNISTFHLDQQPSDKILYVPTLRTYHGNITITLVRDPTGAADHRTEWQKFAPLREAPLDIA